MTLQISFAGPKPSYDLNFLQIFAFFQSGLFCNHLHVLVTALTVPSFFFFLRKRNLAEGSSAEGSSKSSEYRHEWHISKQTYFADFIPSCSKSISQILVCRWGFDCNQEHFLVIIISYSSITLIKKKASSS